MPKISVCIPTFNRFQLLPFAIESVLNQSEQDFELIICDDGSSDRTPEIVSEYTDNRIKYIRHPQNIGKSNNMRSGFDAASGEYLIKFDDDDRLTSDFLYKTATILDLDPSLDFVGTDHWLIDINNVRDEEKTRQNSQYWGRSDLLPGIVPNLLEVVFVRQSFQIGATLFRRQALVDVGFMMPNWQNCEDNDLFVRLAASGKKAYYLPELLMEYRVHAGQQGIHRAIPYLQDKIRYLASYQFPSPELEKIRLNRLAQAQLILGLRLIEQGETAKGRELVLSGKSAGGVKAFIGLGCSLLPTGWRSLAFQTLRGLR